MLNKIHNEDCNETITRLLLNNLKVNVVLTSPPYNTSYNEKDPHKRRYTNYNDYLTDDVYISKTVTLFNNINNVLERNGVVLYNLSYSARHSSLWIKVLFNIIQETPFDVADTIIWKKSNAIPDNSSPNRLTRLTEFVFVICRKDEMRTFKTNKRLKQKVGYRSFYHPIPNYIEAKNNDGNCSLNKATFSTDLCNQLLDMYAKPNDIIYDPFMGSGTTAISAIRHNCSYIGSEIDSAQVEYANERLKSVAALTFLKKPPTIIH